jgi:hypothetical protein
VTYLTPPPSHNPSSCFPAIQVLSHRSRVKVVCLLQQLLGAQLTRCGVGGGCRLVLQPVQRMVERVREMAEDPLMLATVRNQPAFSSSSGSGEF